ncbi:MAG TPA: hypothetical protein VJ728_04850 [Candidatus Binataceae bacterium]|nr:hypothetical protein [Candidatus Binataceae bacterium]
MKRALMAVSAVAALTAGSIGAANALEFGMGPGGVYVGSNDHYYITATTITEAAVG